MSNSDTCDTGLVLWPGGSLLPRPGKHSGWRRDRGTLALGSSFWFPLLSPGVQLFICCKQWKLIFGSWDGTAVPYILAWNTHGPITVNTHHCTPTSLYLGFSSMDLLPWILSTKWLQCRKCGARQSSENVPDPGEATLVPTCTVALLDWKWERKSIRWIQYRGDDWFWHPQQLASILWSKMTAPAPAGRKQEKKRGRVHLPKPCSIA